ncbi:helix-turn-helix domain-containing protein [Clostridium butyricum]|uniref:Putative DNA-binding protein n=1 Tax=Clostridium butyricum E4 str. BoNT E BL5262 TaxID=632245 RepID=C4IGV1_CLOBU|nr:helix-turn-helix transcriptional regulator [Clostridium butyricum]EDT74726.1 putative DNA-binding protein [Clostridium butyricum 5521]EEP53047.1 putative DNA-binding protein [Clostridium butyricum E4 str. BoNT E BL5262]NFL30516.1 helix-turn-helix transcriptional regulator [Clostridium butyricum]NFS19471.1 helix-turn-helix transcriptional regulator [Clostridium butyricum]
MNKIKKIRKEKKLTVRELAEKSEIAPSYISQLENDIGNNINPTKRYMEKIAMALQKTVPEVFY